MYDKTIRRVALILLAVVLALPACSLLDKVAPGRKKTDYKKSKAVQTLEVPPELSSSTINEAPESLNAARASVAGNGAATGAGSATSRVMPVEPDVTLHRDGNQQWLVVKATPEQVWPKIREFWAQQGFLIRMEDPAIGIMETDWTENRADIPQGFIRKALGKVMDAVYSAPTRDKYRVRLERGAGGSTEIYLTQRGVEEVTTGSATDSSTIWQPRPSDPELEAEMLKRLMVYLGAQEQQAENKLAQTTASAAHAHLVSDAGGSMLVIDEDYSRAWRRTGVALDRVGFVVEDRDRSAGNYFVNYNDPLAEQKEKGFLSKLAFWSSDDKNKSTSYRIHLTAAEGETHVVVNNAQGERDTSPTAKRILTLLEEQLR